MSHQPPESGLPDKLKLPQAVAAVVKLPLLSVNTRFGWIVTIAPLASCAERSTWKWWEKPFPATWNARQLAFSMVRPETLIVSIEVEGVGPGGMDRPEVTGYGAVCAPVCSSLPVR